MMVLISSDMHTVFRPLTGPLLAIAVLASLSSVNGAISSENPYVGLTNRNAFGIRPPAPPPAPEVVVAPPSAPPNIFLTGVSHHGGQKKAYFAINRPGSKQPEYETIAEGDELQDLKVLEIDARGGKVRALVAGREVSLNFTENGLKSAAAGVVPGGVPGRPATGIPTPVAPVPTPNLNSPGGGGPVVIGRGGVNLNTRASQYSPSPFPAAGYSPGNVNQDGFSFPTNVRPLPIRPGSDSAPIQNFTQPVDGSGRIPVPIPPPSRFIQ